MNTDKTLADAQPGGRVRLEDGWTGWATQYPNKMPKLCGAREIAELNHYPEEGQRLLFLAENPVHVGDLVDAARAALPFVAFAYSRGVAGAEEAGRAIEAALSAQPSPGGQDALSIEKQARELLAVEYERAGETWAVWAIRNSPMEQLIFQIKGALLATIAALAALQPVRIYGCCAQPEGELHTAECPNMRHLAVRQPVGEPVAWMTHHDEPMLFPTAAEAAAHCEDDEQPVPLFRSPAQAVDLGQFRAKVAELLRSEFDLEVADPEDHRHDDGAGEADRIAGKVIALLDSQAVGK